MKTVYEITLEYLINHDFDGLISDYGDCTCIVDDLMPCESYSIAGCRPAYMIPSNRLTEDDKALMDDMGYDYILSIIKR